MVRQTFRRRPQAKPSALGFAWVCRRYFDVLGGRWGRDWENFRQKSIAEPKTEPKKLSWGCGWSCSEEMKQQNQVQDPSGLTV